MSKKPSLLATAIRQDESAAEQTPAPAPVEARRAAPAPRPAETVPAAYVAPSRAAKRARTHYLHPDYWETLREISYRTRIPQERHLAEALNDYFAKLKFPQVRET